MGGMGGMCRRAHRPGRAVPGAQPPDRRAGPSDAVQTVQSEPPPGQAPGRHQKGEDMKRWKAFCERLPWWLRPWGAAIRSQRAFVVAHLNEIQQAKIIREQDRRIDSLNSEISKLRLGSGQGMPSTQ